MERSTKDLGLGISEARSDLVPHKVYTRSETTSLPIWRAICDLRNIYRRCNCEVKDYALRFRLGRLGRLLSSP